LTGLAVSTNKKEVGGMGTIPVWAVMVGAIAAILIGCFLAIKYGGTSKTGS